MLSFVYKYQVEAVRRDGDFIFRSGVQIFPVPPGVRSLVEDNSELCKRESPEHDEQTELSYQRRVLRASTALRFDKFPPVVEVSERSSASI